MKKITSVLKKKLPQKTKTRLRHIRSSLLHLGSAFVGSEQLVGLNGNFSVQQMLGQLPEPITPDLMRQFASYYDNISNDTARNLYIRDLFHFFSMHPAAGAQLETSYITNRFSDTLVYQIMMAGIERGRQQYDSCISRLTTAQKKFSCDYIPLLVIQTLARPYGREAQLIAYIEQLNVPEKFRTEIMVNLATAYFASGKVEMANKTLNGVKAQWEEKLAASEPLYREDVKALKQELDRAIADKTAYRHTHYDDSIYLEEQVTSHWEPYYHDMTSNAPHVYFGWFNSFYKECLTELAALDNGKAKDIVNFGILCAQPDYEAACAYPQTRFHGVDRQETVKTLNETAYDAENLSFYALEIEEALDQILNRGQPGALFHARVATLCYPQKMIDLYKKCAAMGVEYIMLFENHSISHFYKQFINFEDFPDITLPYKNHQFIHNYKAMLEGAGYEIVRKDIIISPTIHSDTPVDLGSTHVRLLAKLKTA